MDRALVTTCGPAYVSAWVDDDLREAVDELARRRGVSRSDEIRAALAQRVEALEPVSARNEKPLTAA